MLLRPRCKWALVMPRVWGPWAGRGMQERASLSAGSVNPTRELKPDGSDTERTDQAEAAGDDLRAGEEPERGAESAGGGEDEPAVAAGPAGESGMVVP